MIQGALAQLLNQSERTPTSWKWTHLFNTGAFWVLKPLVIVNVICVIVLATVFFIPGALLPLCRCLCCQWLYPFSFYRLEFGSAFK